VAPDITLDLDSPLLPFTKADSSQYTSMDCIDIKGQLGHTCGPGSLDDDVAVKGMDVREGSSKHTLTVSGIDRALFNGSFVLRAYATVQSADGGSNEYYLGHHSVLSRHNVVKCATCMTHQEMIAHFPLHALPESQVDAAQFRVAINQHRGAALPAASDATATLAATSSAAPGSTLPAGLKIVFNVGP